MLNLKPFRKFILIALASVLIVEGFYYSAEKGREQQAEALSVPYVSAPAFAEAVGSLLSLPSLSTFATVGIAVGGAVVIGYAGAKLYQWWQSQKESTAYQTYATNVNQAIADYSVNVLNRSPYTATGTFTDGRIGTLNYPGADYVVGISLYPSEVLSTGIPVLTSSFNGDGFSSSVKWVKSGDTWWYYDAYHHTLMHITSFSLFQSGTYTATYVATYTQYYIGADEVPDDMQVSPEAYIEQGLEDGTITLPPPAFITQSGVDVPLDEFVSIPESAVSYNPDASVDYDEDGTNDTMIFPVPASLSPENDLQTTGDIAVLLPELQAQTEALDRLANKDFTVNTTAIEGSIDNLGNDIKALNDTIVALPENIAKAQNEELEKEAEKITAPSLPDVPVFNTDLDMPEEVDLSKKLADVPNFVPELQVSTSNAFCKIEIPYPWGNVEADFCQYQSIIEAIGDLLLAMSGLYWVYWVFL